MYEDLGKTESDRQLKYQKEESMGIRQTEV